MERHGNEVGGHAAAHDHTTGGESHDGHSHAEPGDDPHIWLDPVKYAEVAKGVGAALAKADPAHAADYEKNTDDAGDQARRPRQGVRRPP